MGAWEILFHRIYVTVLNVTKVQLNQKLLLIDFLKKKLIKYVRFDLKIKIRSSAHPPPAALPTSAET